MFPICNGVGHGGLLKEKPFFVGQQNQLTATILEMATAESASGQKEPFPFLKLPSELQLKVLNRLSYDEISRCRLVSHEILSGRAGVIWDPFFRFAKRLITFANKR